MEADAVLAGRYRLVDELGRGGMSVVWRAHDEVLGRDVAVKFLARTDQARVRASVRAEARAAARLAHPHVASVFDYGEVTEPDGRRSPFVVMELLAGSSLAQLAADGPVPVAVALRVCAQVADALAAAHAEGIVHRDVKPGNVMLTPQGAKIFDFGIAAYVGATDDGDDLAAPVVGTAAYLAPERLAGVPVSPASDVYALGLMLYRLLTHELPFPVTTPAELVQAHMFVEPAAMVDVEGVSSEVGELYRRCVAKSPDQRPSAREVATTLAAAAGLPARGVLLTDRPALVPAPARDAGASATRGFDLTATRGFDPAPAAGPDGSATPPGRDAARPYTVDGRSGPGRAPAPGRLTGLAFGVDRRGWLTRCAVAAALLALAPLGLYLVAAAWGAAGGSGGPVAQVLAAPPATAARLPEPGPSATPAVIEAVLSRSFASAGGVVVARCQGSRPTLVSWLAAPGYRAHDVRRDSTAASVTFQRKGSEITTTISCSAGAPQAGTSSRGGGRPGDGKHRH